jgi:hypothetical protein
VRAQRFSVVRFQEGLIEITREFLARKNVGAGGKARAAGSR